jgi:hypothetical protein
MRKLLIVAAAAAGLGVVAPAGALAFNPQPDPPKVALHVDLGDPACRLTVAWPPGPTAPVVTVRLGLPKVAAALLPPGICYPPGPSTSPR